ncbi:MAG TPA: Ig-like domain-containing protein [Vicinamibacterales bacterium]|nr:Ig-like domain-containing protein [Vicinamibacterales bacterium]
MRPTKALALTAILVVICGAGPGAQGTQRRLTTVDALRQFPGFFHLQNVLVHGEFVENERRISLRGGDTEIRVELSQNVSTASGPVEVRAQLIDVGRLEAGDPRAGNFAQGRESSSWPRPGEELLLQVSAVTPSQPMVTATLRALALEPWKFAGQTVTVTGNFRGRNLFGDLPDAPGKGRYDFIVRGGEGSVWVTGVRPRGSGFDFDVDRRIDSNRWLQITGPLVHDRGLVRIEATKIALAKAPDRSEPDRDDGAPVSAVPLTPAEVVFNSPTEGETDVRPTASIRIQFSKGLAEASLVGHVRASYLGAPAGTEGPSLKTVYDPANRAIEIKFDKPLEALRTVKIEILEGVTAFDRAPLAPWTLTFTVGG